MKNVLIYLREKDLAPTGGSNGYNYTLKKGIELLPDTSDIRIDYLPGQSPSQGINDALDRRKNFGKLKKFIVILKSIIKKGALMYNPFHFSSVDLNKYDAVHFHRTTDLYWVKDSLKKYKGEIILTLHAPTMPAKQMISMLSDFEKEHMMWFYKKLYKIDDYALKTCNHIIIACEEAEEPYFNRWTNYKELHNKYKRKYLYMPTGTEKKNCMVSKNEVREKYGIPLDAFVISYAGRHNEIKGYDILKIIGEKVLNKYSNIYFLIAGNEAPLFKLSHDRWIEVGWTNDPGSIINAADCFILPNRETYFDLILLEVLSLGQIVIASNTGGNKYFKQYRNSGIRLYNNIEEAIKYIDEFNSMTLEERARFGEANYKLYCSQFTNEAFAQRYIETLSQIL